VGASFCPSSLLLTLLGDGKGGKTTKAAEQAAKKK
jgi:hypothetical protein